MMKKLEYITDFDTSIYRDIGTTAVSKCHTHVDRDNKKEEIIIDATNDLEQEN